MARIVLRDGMMRRCTVQRLFILQKETRRIPFEFMRKHRIEITTCEFVRRSRVYMPEGSRPTAE